MSGGKRKPFLDIAIEALNSDEGKARMKPNGLSGQFIAFIALKAEGKMSVQDVERYYRRVQMALRRGAQKGCLIQKKQSFKLNPKFFKKAEPKKKARSSTKAKARSKKKDSKAQPKAATANGKRTKTKAKQSASKRKLATTPKVHKVEIKEDVFRVEKILEEKQENKKTLFLIKWKGYPLKDATWEPKENILTKVVLDEWRNSKSDRKKGHGKNRRTSKQKAKANGTRDTKEESAKPGRKEKSTPEAVKADGKESGGKRKLPENAKESPEAKKAKKMEAADPVAPNLSA